MSFFGCIPKLITVILPALELLLYLLYRKQTWHWFCLAEKEKQARVLSDALRDTLRGVLDMTFDASCDCDSAGRILLFSQHLQELLGRSTSDLVGLDLMQLAASPTEADRINNFLKQMSIQMLEGGSRTASPLAQLETVLPCHTWQQDQFEDGQLTVKMSCVSLPGDCALNGALPSRGGSGHLFLGLQKVHGADCMSNKSETRATLAFERKDDVSDKPDVKMFWSASSVTHPDVSGPCQQSSTMSTLDSNLPLACFTTNISSPLDAVQHWQELQSNIEAMSEGSDSERLRRGAAPTPGDARAIASQLPASACMADSPRVILSHSDGGRDLLAMTSLWDDCAKEVDIDMADSASVFDALQVNFLLPDLLSFACAKQHCAPKCKLVCKLP